MNFAAYQMDQVDKAIDAIADELIVRAVNCNLKGMSAREFDCYIEGMMAMVVELFGIRIEGVRELVQRAVKTRGPWDREE